MTLDAAEPRRRRANNWIGRWQYRATRTSTARWTSSRSTIARSSRGGRGLTQRRRHRGRRQRRVVPLRRGERRDARATRSGAMRATPRSSAPTDGRPASGLPVRLSGDAVHPARGVRHVSDDLGAVLHAAHDHARAARRVSARGQRSRRSTSARRWATGCTAGWRTLPRAQLDRMWSIYIAGEYNGMHGVLADLYALDRRRGVPRDREVLRQHRALRRPTVDEPGHRSTAATPTSTSRSSSATCASSSRPASRDFLAAAAELLGHGRAATASTPTAAPASARSSARATSSPATTRTATTPRPVRVYNMLKLSRNLFFHDRRPEVHELLRAGAVRSDPRLAPRHRQRHGPAADLLRARAPGRRAAATATSAPAAAAPGWRTTPSTRTRSTSGSADDSALYVNLYIAVDADAGRRRASRSSRRRTIRPTRRRAR